MQIPSTEDLRQVHVLRDLSEEHLKWIFDHAEYVEFKDGEVMAKTGDIVDFLFLQVEGIVSFYQNVNGKLVHFIDMTNDEKSGGANGLLPYSRMKESTGDAYAVGKLRGYKLNKKYFGELEQLNPDLIQRFVGLMTDRARYFASMQLQQEKVSALGKLAAGIAHELNNPAAAINRIADELSKRLTSNFELTKQLLEFNVQPDLIENIQTLVDQKKAEKLTKLTALERIEAEEEFTVWFQKNNFDEIISSAEVFMNAGFTIDDFEKLKTKVDPIAFVSVLKWLENLLTSNHLMRDMNDASCRISTLVTSIKSHVHMDRTNDVQKTNIHKALENNVTLLGFKLREKNISVKQNFCENLPMVDAYVGELNQVWTNLIDNAIYALQANGEIEIKTSFDDKNVSVKIIDNGKGIQPEIISRIFDPFFTTKKVGDGTGIGLDIVNRIIANHKGTIKVNSIPGKTEFIVCIPIKAS